jgi:hypothetical protein
MNHQLIGSRHTPLDEAYATCERAVAELRVYPSKLRIDDVNQILGVAATDAKNQGTVVEGARGRTREIKRTYWSLSSDGVIQSLDLRDHLNWLLDTVPTSIEPFERLARDDGLTMCVSCIWWSRGGHGGPTLWPEQMSRLASLGLECTFDIQFYGDDEV